MRIRDQGRRRDQRTDCNSSSLPCSMRLVSSLFVLLITMSTTRAESTCELDFDTIYCDYNTSSGYGFIRDEIWNIECYEDEINVIQSSARPSPYGAVDVVFSDTQYIFIVQGSTVYVTKDSSFTSYDHMMSVKDLFSGFDEKIVSAFYYKEQVFLYNGIEFTIFNQRVFRVGNQPAWSFSSMHHANKKLSHEKLSNLKASLVVPIDAGKGGFELILLLKGNQYYRFSSVDYCIASVSNCYPAKKK